MHWEWEKGELFLLMEREFYSVYVEYEDGIGREAISLDGFFDRVKEVLEDTCSKDYENDFFVSNLQGIF